LLVAPRPGRLRILPPERFRRGQEWVHAGQPVVRIERGAHADAVVSPIEGRLGGVLAREGEPVTAGQAVAWVESLAAPES
jgi:biotin carboxyl carrier protein